MKTVETYAYAEHTGRKEGRKRVIQLVLVSEKKHKKYLLCSIDQESGETYKCEEHMSVRKIVIENNDLLNE